MYKRAGPCRIQEARREFPRKHSEIVERVPGRRSGNVISTKFFLSTNSSSSFLHSIFPSLGKYSNACLEEAKKGENFVFLYFLSFLSFDSKGRSITQFTQLRSEVSRFRLVYSITRQAMISDSRLSLIRETLPERERERVCVLKGNVDARSSGENTKFINIRSWAEKEEERGRGGGRRDN